MYLKDGESIDFMVIDTETTSLNEFREIVELGMLVGQFSRQDDIYHYSVIDKFHSLIRPNRPISKEAERVNGVSQEELDEAPVAVTVRSDLMGWWAEGLEAKQFLILGHNYGNFDSPLIRAFLSTSYDEMFDYHSVDTWNLAFTAQMIGVIDSGNSLSLEDLADELKIPHKYHKAIGDCYATIGVYTELMNRIMNRINNTVRGN